MGLFVGSSGMELFVSFNCIGWVRKEINFVLCLVRVSREKFIDMSLCGLLRSFCCMFPGLPILLAPCVPLLLNQ